VDGSKSWFKDCVPAVKNGFYQFVLGGQWFVAMLNVAPMLMVAGYYLSFFFTISHNFRGVHMHQDTRREVNGVNSFLYNQVKAMQPVVSWSC
jgi:hypothetical protein